MAKSSASFETRLKAAYAGKDLGALLVEATPIVEECLSDDLATLGRNEINGVLERLAMAHQTFAAREKDLGRDHEFARLINDLSAHVSRFRPKPGYRKHKGPQGAEIAEFRRRFENLKRDAFAEGAE